MPGVDSFATLATLQRNHPELKVIMVATTNDTRAAVRARAAGAHDMLYKPFYTKDVDAMMNRLCGLTGPKAG
jgi:DNA-binding NtrC family response regulator